MSYNHKQCIKIYYLLRTMNMSYIDPESGANRRIGITADPYYRFLSTYVPAWIVVLRDVDMTGRVVEEERLRGGRCVRQECPDLSRVVVGHCSEVDGLRDDRPKHLHHLVVNTSQKDQMPRIL